MIEVVYLDEIDSDDQCLEDYSIFRHLNLHFVRLCKTSLLADLQTEISSNFHMGFSLFLEAIHICSLSGNTYILPDWG